MAYDVAIVGGGPGGVAAGVYAARKKLRTVFITDSFGGQSLISADIQNWIGTPSISGFDLAQALERHVKSYPEIDVVEGTLVEAVTSLPPVMENGKTLPRFSLVTSDGKTYEATTILLTSGSRRRRLEVPGEKEFEGRGVMYCSICDAPLFAGKDVAVVGGGNSGLEAVIDLLPYAKTITLLHRSNALKGDPVTQEKIKKQPHVSIILNAEIKTMFGSQSLIEGIVYRDKNTGKDVTLSVQGVFVEIGATPNSDVVKDLVTRTERGAVVVNHKTQRTSRIGIWAAGDVTDGLYRQNNISVGDSIKALLDIYSFLRLGDAVD